MTSIRHRQRLATTLALFQGWVCLPALHAQTEAASPSFQLDTAIHAQDSDGDGLPDAWEIANGLSTSVNDAAGDPDGDQLNNLAEYNAGTSPRVFDPITSASAASASFTLSLRSLAPDQDGDGMPDAFEVANGLNPAVNDAALDADGDGRTNLAEYNAGSDPRLADSGSSMSAVSPLFLTDTGAYPGGYTRDSDGDGMPDWWEARYSLNPAVNDAALDPDNDGWSNLTEYLTGFEPRHGDLSGTDDEASPLFTGNFSGQLPDSDHDGIPDAWELAFGTNPALADANADPDGDGRSNLAEYNAGTNPLVNDWLGPAALGSLNFLVDTGGINGGYAPDSDHDGMPDAWELAHGLNPAVADANGNPDGDALTNIQEYNAGSDPSVFGYFIFVNAQGNVFTCDTGGVFLDTDGDGIPDWWERQYTGDPLALSPSGDNDGDGTVNLDEYLAGLNPLSGASRFEVTGTEAGTDASGRFLKIKWQSVSGRRYKIYTNSGLSGAWPASPVATVDGDGSEKSYMIRPGAAAKIFARIGVEVLRP